MYKEVKVDLQAFNYICKKCGHQFVGTRFPDFEYGRRIFRTKGGKYRAIWVGYEDVYFDEFEMLMRKVIGSTMSQREEAKVFDKIFGISCDPINDQPIDVSQTETCPQCGSDIVDAFEIIPKLVMPTILPLIQHTLWSKKNSVEKEHVIRSAIKQMNL